MDGSCGLREVIPNQSVPPPVREFTITTGGAQSTLQDIKLPDTAGGYTYIDDGTCPAVANRTIYWRTSHDTIEINEVSLNHNLVGGRVRFRFIDTPLLPGISVHEAWGQLVMLVPTVGSVHKLAFPHPSKLEKSEVAIVEGGLMSVLSEASAATARDCQHIINWPASTPLPSIATTYFTGDEEAVFVLGNTVGQLTCVKLGRVRGMTSVNSLAAPSSYLGRVWSSLTGSGPDNRHDQPSSFVIGRLSGSLSLLAVCRDHKLRAWSLSTYECVMATDLVQFTAEAGRQMSQGAQGHRISLTEGQEKDQECLMALYLCFQQHSQFLLVRVTSQTGQLVVTPVSTVYSPAYDLVNYSVTDKGIVAVWTSGEGDTIVRRTVTGGTPGWDTVTTCDGETIMPDDLEMNELEDPRQVYLGALFAPGAFLASTLSKTLAIFRRSLDREVANMKNGGWDRLRADVVSAVESEIQANLAEYEVSDEDYVVTSRTAWARFYSCACQYRTSGLQPMGLVTSPDNSSVMMIRRDLVSWLRQVEALEQVVVSGEIGVTVDIFNDIPPISDNPGLANDVLHMLTVAGMVGRQLPPYTLRAFGDAVGRLASPDLVSKSIAAELLADQEQPTCLQEVLGRVQLVHDVGQSLECLLYCLELDRGSVSSGELDISRVERDEVCRVFSSDLGTSLVAESLRQQVETRLMLAQHLLITQHLVLGCGSTMLSPTSLDSIQSTYLPRTTVMVHCYTVLNWLCSAPATPPNHAMLSQSRRQLAVLRLGHDTDVCPAAKENTSILETFLMGPGARVRAVVGDMSGDAWLTALGPLTNMTAQLLWPRCATPTFLHFLLVSCQHGLIQQYCRLLSTWCDWHCHARQFLLATALLNMCESEKAADLFLSAAGGVPGDKFLTDHMLNLSGDTADDLTVSYFLRVISLLEQFSCPDLVISMAETGLAVAPQTHMERPTLAYILFTYHLKLGHNDDAYDAMVSNPDSLRRKDSLRQFLVTLFDRGELGTLAHYPYIDMLDDVETIIECRARSADLSVNNYYDFLYSFHVMKENYRKAAHVMYECGARLGTELVSLAGLKKQAQAYLASINSLKLVNEKYQWIVKPVSTGSPGESPKRSADGEEKEIVRQRIDVVELVDIEKELVLTQARLKLVTFSNSTDRSLPIAPGLTPAETVGLLVSANLFMDAVTICQTYNLNRSLVGVVEGVASKCAKLSHSRGTEQAAAWTWLAENRPGGVEITGECAVEASWQLLQHIVTSREEVGCSRLHRAVVTRLASLTCSFPTWLLAGYKRRDPAELIRVFHSLGYLERAGELAEEYINAVMGDGAEYFGLDEGLHAGGKPAWVPWTVLDRLLLELTHHSDHVGVSKVKARLEDTVGRYLDTVERVSKDMIAQRA